MRNAGDAQARPYHHGDLSRALVDAARRILETEGPDALSLRAVAREAGVSPAAPYHHFKDKNELFGAVAKQGWQALREALAQAKCDSVQDAAIKTGLAYVRFATENPALYRLMYDMARTSADLPEAAGEKDSGFALVEEAIREAGREIIDPIDLQLSIIAAWCASHGLAEMASFKRFDALKAEMGGEENFLTGVLQHIGALTHVTKPTA